MFGLSKYSNQRVHTSQITVVDSKPNYQLKSDLIFDGNSIKIKMKLIYFCFNSKGMPIEGKVFKLKLKKSNMPQVLLELQENVINVFYSYFEPKHHYQVCEDGRIRFEYKIVGNRKQIAKHVQVQMQFKRNISEIQSLRLCLQKQRYEHQLYKKQVQNKKQAKQQQKQLEQKKSEQLKPQMKIINDEKIKQGGESTSAIQKQKPKIETKIKAQQKKSKSQQEQKIDDILIKLQNDIYKQNENEKEDEDEDEDEKESRKQKQGTKMMRYEYKEQGNILFKQKATKFKVNDNQLDMFVEINVIQDLEKKLYWVHVKNQGVFTHKYAGLLVKGQSEIKKFGGKQENVVVSVYAMENTKPKQLIFKIQFEDSKQSDKFIEVVENIIGKWNKQKYRQKYEKLVQSDESK